jgi:hypothetical protein
VDYRGRSRHGLILAMMKGRSAMIRPAVGTFVETLGLLPPYRRVVIQWF